MRDLSFYTKITQNYPGFGHKILIFVKAVLCEMPHITSKSRLYCQQRSLWRETKHAPALFLCLFSFWVYPIKMIF